jgi:hypothetical protein
MRNRVQDIWHSFDGLMGLFVQGAITMKAGTWPSVVFMTVSNADIRQV